jgi:hypothetical protein
MLLSKQACKDYKQESIQQFVSRERRTVLNNPEILDRYLNKAMLKSDSKNLVRVVLNESFKKMPSKYVKRPMTKNPSKTELQDSSRKVS